MRPADHLAPLATAAIVVARVRARPGGLTDPVGVSRYRMFADPRSSWDGLLRCSLVLPDGQVTHGIPPKRLLRCSAWLADRLVVSRLVRQDLGRPAADALAREILSGVYGRPWRASGERWRSERLHGMPYQDLQVHAYSFDLWGGRPLDEVVARPGRVLYQFRAR